MDVEFFFDPVCTWSWVASRWLLEVAPRRGLRVYWRSFSKLIGLGTQGLRDWDLTSRTASHRALRVMEAVRADDPIVGEGARTPVTVLWLDRPVGFQGPLVSPAPTGSAALELWDSFVKLASLPGVFGLSRPRPPRPQMSPAWSSLTAVATPPPSPDGR